MPEESFEEQARRMSERFSMEPKPDVWQQVEAAIAPEKKKRRLLVWWWLLPLFIAGGLSALLFHRDNALAVKHEAPVVAGEKGSVAKNEEASVAGKEAKEKEEILALEKIQRTRRNSGKIKKKEDGTGTMKEEKKDDEIKITAAKTAAKKEMIWNEKKKDDVAQPSLSKPEISKDKQAIVGFNNKLLNESAQLSHEQKSILTKPLFTGPDVTAVLSSPAATAGDSVAAKTITAGNVPDSAKDKSAATVIVIHKKKQEKQPWQWGIVAEAGVSSWGSHLFRIFGSGDAQMKFDNNSGSFDQPAAPVTNDSLSSSSLYSYQVTRKGRDAGLGIMVKKMLPHHFYISGQLSYRYQQYGISHYVRDTLLLNNANFSLINYQAGSESYHLHFANLFTGIGWQFWQMKKMALAAETGVDNSWVVSVTERETNLASAAQGRGVIQSQATNNFYRWQPHVTVSVPVLFGGSAFRWQVAPFVRFGLRSFQKGSIAYSDNHLVSAGFRAVYFFR